MPTYKILVFIADEYSDFEDKFDKWDFVPVKVKEEIIDGIRVAFQDTDTLQKIKNFVDNYNQEEEDYQVWCNGIEDYTNLESLAHYIKGLGKTNEYCGSLLYVYCTEVN